MDADQRDAAVSPAAVIVTVQESGSVRYYTRRPILRWDQLGPDLDAAVAAVQQWQYSPLVLNGIRTPFVVTVTLNFGFRPPESSR